MRLHCIADTVFFPENGSELIATVRQQTEPYVLLAGGSNFILPTKLHKPVILLTDMKEEISISGTLVMCSASVRIQKLIRTMQTQNLGGMEYLFSVPCTVGGAVYMNAGRGEVYQKSISDFVVSVKCFDPSSNQIVTLDKDSCQFSHRHSVFNSNNLIILDVIFEMNSIPSDQIETAIRERISYATHNQDSAKPSAGSIFKYCNSNIMSRFMGLKIGGARWSAKTPNWISNVRNAKNWQVLALIKIAQAIHKVCRKSCTREVKIVR